MKIKRVNAMKKSIVTLIVCVLVLLYTNESPSQLIKGYGIKLGLTSADQKLDYAVVPDIKTKRRLGLISGVYVEWLDIPFISVITEVDYTQRGNAFEIDVMTEVGSRLGNKTFYSRLDYLSIPVLVKATLPGTIVSPYVVAGPRFDFLLGYKSDGNAFSDLYDIFKKNISGGTVGLGAETGSLLHVTLTADFRYNFDFTKSFKNQYLEVTNNAFDFMLGVRF
jgi:hypothetical protein